LNSSRAQRRAGGLDPRQEVSDVEAAVVIPQEIEIPNLIGVEGRGRPSSCAVTSAVASVGIDTNRLKVRLVVVHDVTVAVYVKLPLARGKPERRPVAASSVTPVAARPVTLQTMCCRRR